MMMGLADGRILYDALKDRIHPLGWPAAALLPVPHSTASVTMSCLLLSRLCNLMVKARFGMTSPMLKSTTSSTACRCVWLVACADGQISPCRGWMNSNGIYTPCHILPCVRCNPIFSHEM